MSLKNRLQSYKIQFFSQTNRQLSQQSVLISQEWVFVVQESPLTPNNVSLFLSLKNRSFYKGVSPYLKGVCLCLSRSGYHHKGVCLCLSRSGYHHKGVWVLSQMSLLFSLKDWLLSCTGVCSCFKWAHSCLSRIDYHLRAVFLSLESESPKICLS